MKSSIFARKSLSTITENGPEHDLWTCVLSKAAHDAIHCTDWRESRAAIAWFKAGRKDFKEVCQYAGRDPSYVHKVMELPIKRREQEMRNIRR